MAKYSDKINKDIVRTCLHKRMRTSFRQILPKTALKILAGRQARLRIFALS